MSAGRITLYAATSVDGYLADASGDVAWLDEVVPEAESADDPTGFAAFLESVDCLVMGATTYEQVLGFGEWPYGETPTYVFSHRQLPAATDAVAFVDGSVSTHAADLRRRYRHIWLVGGAQLAQAFLRAGHVDTLRLFLAPVLLGTGIRLFGDEDERRGLVLVGTKTPAGGLVELEYTVEGLLPVGKGSSLFTE